MEWIVDRDVVVSLRWLSIVCWCYIVWKMFVCLMVGIDLLMVLFEFFR